ncbi:MAG TPA: AAA family ATPase [Candidatus Acidoferrales bacterium]|jgi:hypothetical protein|nr:AAA family ATPase [Candidatus Acidoferrales bacterium]
MNELLDMPSFERQPPMEAVGHPSSTTGVLSLHQLLEHHPTPAPALIEPGLLPSSGILFLGGEPKLGKSILAANLALALASGWSRLGFQVPAPRRVLMCQFELPTSQFAQRLHTMRQDIGSAADSNLFVDTQAAGHLLSTPHGLDHFMASARAVNAEVIVFDPLYSTHDQDENDTRAMSALCQSLLRLRDGCGAALLVIHHVRKVVGRHEIGSAFRGSSALHAVGDSYLLLSRLPSETPTLELRFQFRYAPAPQPRRLSLDPNTLWFDTCRAPAAPARAPRKVETTTVQRVLTESGPVRFNQLRQRIMDQSQCSRRTAQVAIQRACDQGSVVSSEGLYRLPS